MEGKMVKLIVAVVVAVVVILPRPPFASANLMKIGCIGICMRECRLAGVGIPACLKYCPVHCDPPLPTHRAFHCTLECLNQCVSSESNNNNNNDEEKQDSCVSSCKNEKCNPSP